MVIFPQLEGIQFLFWLFFFFGKREVVKKIWQAISKCGFEMTACIYKSLDLPWRKLNILTKNYKQLFWVFHSVFDHLPLLIHFK